MKKLVLSAIFLTLSAPIFAQATLYEGFFQPGKPLFSAVKRAVANVLPEEKVSWIKEVRHQERLSNTNGPVGASFHGFPARSFRQKPVIHHPEIYHQRRLAFEALVKNNHTLSGYKFKATRPDDLTDLSNTQVHFLQQFLIQPMSKKSFNTRYTPLISHPQGAETQLSFFVDGKQLILLISSRPESKTVYFFAKQVPTTTKSTEKNSSHSLPYTGRVVSGHLVPSF